MIGIADPLHRDGTGGMPVWFRHTSSGAMQQSECLIFRIGPPGALDFSSEAGALGGRSGRTRIQDDAPLLVRAVIPKRPEALRFIDFYCYQFGGDADSSAATENGRFFATLDRKQNVVNQLIADQRVDGIRYGIALQDSVPL